jgi:hypothetical protein
MVLNKFDEFMQSLQLQHDTSEAHDNLDITQELKSVSYSFNGMEVIIHYKNQKSVFHKYLLHKKQQKDPPNIYIAK